MFYPPGFVHRVSQVLADVELVMHDVRVWQTLIDRLDVGGGHVNAHTANHLSLFLVEGFGY